MGAAAVPNSLGMGANRPQLDEGTSPSTAMPDPTHSGAAGAEPPTVNAAAPASAAPTIDAAIEALDLSKTARDAAYALKTAYPGIAFTSGRRSKERQATAMAGNVVANRKWIEQTYAESTLRTHCQDWVDAHPDSKTAAEVAEGLRSVFDAAPDADLGKFSKHLSGEAFDVQPVDKNADEIKKSIRGLSGLSKFLDKEGGLVRWHAEF